MADLHQLYDQADRLKDEGKYEEAVAQLEEILKQDETFALAHSALAVLLGRMGRHEEAIAHGQRVCQLEPNDPFSFTALSVTYQRAFAGTNRREYIQLAEDAMARSQTLQMGG